jgi:hypothetical protein
MFCELLKENVCSLLVNCSNEVNHHIKISVVWVRERTIPTERPPLVREVIANVCG